jgi:hypothetical protein
MAGGPKRVVFRVMLDGGNSRRARISATVLVALAASLQLGGACGLPKPCKYDDTPGPSYWTGTVQPRIAGAIESGTMSITIFSDQAMDEGPTHAPPGVIGIYDCSARVSGILRFASGHTVELAGLDSFTVVYHSGDMLAGDSGPYLTFSGGGYRFEQGETGLPGLSGTIVAEDSGSGLVIGTWQLHPSSH